MNDLESRLENMARDIAATPRPVDELRPAATGGVLGVWRRRRPALVLTLAAMVIVGTVVVASLVRSEPHTSLSVSAAGDTPAPVEAPTPPTTPARSDSVGPSSHEVVTTETTSCSPASASNEPMVSYLVTFQDGTICADVLLGDFPGIRVYSLDGEVLGGIQHDADSIGSASIATLLGTGGGGDQPIVVMGTQPADSGPRTIRVPGDPPTDLIYEAIDVESKPYSIIIIPLAPEVSAPTILVQFGQDEAPEPADDETIEALTDYEAVLEDVLDADLPADSLRVVDGLLTVTVAGTEMVAVAGPGGTGDVAGYALGTAADGDPEASLRACVAVGGVGAPQCEGYQAQLDSRGGVVEGLTWLLPGRVRALDVYLLTSITEPIAYSTQFGLIAPDRIPEPEILEAWADCFEATEADLNADSSCVQDVADEAAAYRP